MLNDWDERDNFLFEFRNLWGKREFGGYFVCLLKVGASLRIEYYQMILLFLLG